MKGNVAKGNVAKASVVIYKPLVWYEAVPWIYGGTHMVLPIHFLAFFFQWLQKSLALHASGNVNLCYTALEMNDQQSVLYFPCSEQTIGVISLARLQLLNKGSVYFVQPFQKCGILLEGDFWSRKSSMLRSCKCNEANNHAATCIACFQCIVGRNACSKLTISHDRHTYVSYNFQLVMSLPAWS